MLTRRFGFQGYVRSARLFLLAKKPDSASRMLAMALERTAADDSKRQARLQLLQEEVELALKAQRRRISRSTCHVSKLPYEILSDIMLLAVSSGQAKVLSTLWDICSISRSTEQLFFSPYLEQLSLLFADNGEVQL